MELHSGTFSPDDFAWRGLTLTPVAAAHTRELVTKQPDMLGVRLNVKQAGRVGFGYVLDTVHQPEKDDLLFETEGVRLYVPLQAMPFIDGIEVDFAREGLNQLFKFHNPKVQNECGCGEGFGVQAILCLVIPK